MVYFAFSSYCDAGNFYGWVLGYDPVKLSLLYSFVSSPLGHDGIWQSGTVEYSHSFPDSEQGLSVDTDGYIYLTTGNGNWNQSLGAWSNSVLKLAPSGDVLTVVDYFAAEDQDEDNSEDRDVGCSGVLIFPGTNVILSGNGFPFLSQRLGSKEGIIYVIDRTNMTKWAGENKTNVLLTEMPILNGHIHGTPVYYHSAGSGSYLYVWSENDSMKQFQFSVKAPNIVTVGSETVSQLALPKGQMPGGMLAISSNNGENGILWATTPIGDANHATTPGNTCPSDYRNS